ncbi:MAG: PAS domain S-box protein [Gammaproteobacteria bacterium]|nr:PAS domain S-box protein [Gammaproteobacteria bacterium]
MSLRGDSAGTAHGPGAGVPTATPGQVRLRPALLAGTCLAGAALIFAFDLVTPLGVADGMLYAGVVLLGLWHSDRRAVLVIAVIGSVLTGAGFVLSPPGGVPWMAAVNRLLALLAIWTTAVLAYLHAELSARLHREHELAESLFETAQAIVLLLDPRGRILRYNGYTQDLLGVPLAEARGRDWIATFVPPAEHDRVRDVLETAAGGVSTGGNVNGVIARDGSVRVVEWFDTRLRDAGGALTAILAIGTDITARRDAEIAREDTLIQLRTRNLELTAIAEIGQSFLSGEELRELRPRVVALARELLGANAVALVETHAGTGWAVTAATGWPAGLVGGEHIAMKPGSLFARTLAAERVIEIPDLRAADEPAATGLPDAGQFASGVGVPVRGAAGPHGVLAAFMRSQHRFGDDEIAFLQTLANTLGLAVERQRSEGRARRLQRDLLRATRESAVVDFGATLAHELNQPITAVMNYVQAASGLMERESDAAQSRTYLDRAVDEAERAGEILRRLRQLVHGGMTEHVCTEINEVVRDAARLALCDVDEARVQVRFECAAALPPVLIDTVQIQQVVFNLVRNAVEAMHDMTDAALRLATRPHTRDFVEVLIEDQGPGLDAGAIHDDSRRFRSSKEGGMGIGLSICRSIVTAHGGRLWVTPTAGAGATLHFTVPVAKQGR